MSVIAGPACRQAKREAASDPGIGIEAEGTGAKRFSKNDDHARRLCGVGAGALPSPAATNFVGHIEAVDIANTPLLLV